MDFGEWVDLNGRRLPRGAVVAVAMSGGVDSSVAAALAWHAGLDTVGVTMRLWGSEEMERGEGGCCSIDAVEDARRVCSRLGIAHYVLNMAEHFRRSVVGDFLSQYAAGRTPNPCIRCNEKVKFSELWRRMGAVGATHIASGHYAQVRGEPTGWCTLHRGVRPAEGSVLHAVPQRPGGSLAAGPPAGAFGEARPCEPWPSPWSWRSRRNRTLRSSASWAAGTIERCWSRSWRESSDPGPITDLSGAEVGRHRGLPFYTVGQRQGLGLAVREPATEPHYVVRVDPARNTLVVGPWRTLLQRQCQVDAVCISGRRSRRHRERSGLVQLRAHGQPVEASWQPEQEAAPRFVSPSSKRGLRLASRWFSTMGTESLRAERSPPPRNRSSPDGLADHRDPDPGRLRRVLGRLRRRSGRLGATKLTAGSGGSGRAGQPGLGGGGVSTAPRPEAASAGWVSSPCSRGG